MKRNYAHTFVVLAAFGASACRSPDRGEAHAVVDAGSDAPRLTVLLDRSGVVTLAGGSSAKRLLLDDDIVTAFRAFHERTPRGRLFIRAHRATLHGRLVRIVDLAKEAEVGFDLEVVES